MVIRKPLPQDYDAVNVGNNDPDGVPDILRPGRNPNPDPNPSRTTPSPYSNFDAEEQSVWRIPGAQQQQQPQQRPQAPVPTILLQSATGSSTASAFSDTNPFKRKVMATENSSSPIPPAPQAPPPLPPTASLAQLSMDDQNRNPWQPGVAESSRSSSTPLPTIHDSAEAEAEAGAGEQAWASQAHVPLRVQQLSGRVSPMSGAAPASFRNSNLISFPPDEDGDSAGWDEVASPNKRSAYSVAPDTAPPRPPFTPLGSKDGPGSDSAVFEDRHAWDDLSGNAGAGAGGSTQPKPLPIVTEATGEGWNMVDSEPVPGQLSRQSTWENFSGDEDDDETERRNTPGQSQQITSKAKGKAVNSADPGADTPEPLISFDSPQSDQPLQHSQSALPEEPAPSAKQAVPDVTEEPAPRLPPRNMVNIGEDAPPQQPPRTTHSDKAETYQIKLVTWHDFRSGQNPRVSPILVQNANGPCPLVALVNALSLTTPAETSTALVETLSTREQISLSFLLDAVFDELMSSRRSSNESSLPDVDELYKFLKGLHTGMNVNPRFIPTQDVLTAFRRTSLTHLHPTERDDMIPGTFENTREMQLYSTFNIPLIHGWLPEKGDTAYAALSRQAASYEDVQNLLFREEELEEKLSSPTSEGLTQDEQALYQDILEIKTFLNVSATQLTPFGLNVVAKAMMPGTFAILFRNDHFSTLYRHPQTMQLLSLVTDAGYAGHDEVIWETLVDVNGEHAEFFSGDFRLVGGNGHQERRDQYAGAGASGSEGGGASSSGQGSGWTAVRGRRPRNNDVPGGHNQSMANEELSRHEQEDRDLALALQLQEEEEEQHRAEEARRNSRLSEQFIEQNGRPSLQGQPQGRRPSNAAGGGRYSSSSPQSQVSPRRSSAGIYSNNSLLGVGGDNNSQNRRTSSSSASGSGLYHGRTSSSSPSQQQAVRPLVPPAATTTAASTVAVAPRIVSGRPAVHRPPNAEEEIEAPPSYEQAAQQAPYHPPPGAPGSETSLSGRNSTASASTSTLPSQRPSASYGSSGRPYVTPGSYAQQPYRQQQMAGSRTDRECILM